MTERVLNAIQILILAAILFAALVLQVFYGEEPCPLCYLQRLFMFGIAAGLCLNLKSGVRKQHYGLSILSALLGASISLRQMALHICPGYPEFGELFWGISLYTWAFFVFTASVGVNALMMVIFKKEKEHRLIWFDQTAFGLIILAALLNVVLSYLQCGIGPCPDVATVAIS